MTSGNNSRLSEAIKEAYASAPAHVLFFDTLEIRHPEFLDHEGKKAPIRVVNNTADIMAALEDSAPLDPGKEVLFRSFAFEFDLPAVSDKSSPQVAVKIDNVDREILENIERVVQSKVPVRLIYRIYLNTDLTAPQSDPPMHLTLDNIKADAYQVSAVFHIGDFANGSFPKEKYSPGRFPGLVR